MHVVIVESPAKAKTINKYLGNDFTVIASYGHIRDLPSKDGSVRPEEDFAMTYEISDKSVKHVKAIADAVKKADTVYLATDPDREGEAISWHILEALKERKALKKDIKIGRVVFHEITKRAVTEAVANPRDIDLNLVNAQQARRALDYLVGFTLSPVLWRKLPGSKSAGRVQSVALRLIADREGEIEQFISREYWDIKVELQAKNGAAVMAALTHVEGKKLDKFDLPNKDAAETIAAQLKARRYQVTDIVKKQTSRNPYAPFTTSSLQQEASRKLGFGAKKTMQIAQKLYEGVDIGGETVGLITYMRTDGVQVSQEALTATRALIAQQFGDSYLPKAPRIYTAKAKNAQEAHEPIRPTHIEYTPQRMKQTLEADYYALYALIWKRMVASQMESVLFDQVAATIATEDNYAHLRAVGSTIRFDGFYVLYRESKDDEEDEEQRALPPMEKGDNLPLSKVLPAQHFTEPPPRYSEASLVKKLEELGIGRPSTYASIISVLQERNYVRLEKKRFIPEERGRLVTAFLTSFFQRYVEYDFTANLEDELDQISAGELDWKKVLRAFWADFSNATQEVKGLEISVILEALNTLLEAHVFPVTEPGKDPRACPLCGTGRLSLKLGKFGAFIACSHYPECHYTRQLSDAAEEGQEGAAANVEANEPRILGDDPVSGKAVSVRKGPYGFYVQLGEAEKGSKEKPKRLSIPPGFDPLHLNFEQGLALLSLPRAVGMHPETSKPVSVGIGKFGPYILHDGKYTSLPKDEDVLSIGLNRVISLLAESKQPAKKAEPLRIVGKHPEDGKDIAIMEGRYGPYIKHDKTNAPMPKNRAMEDISLEEAIELIAAQAAKKGKAPAKAKAPAKKAEKAEKPAKEENPAKPVKATKTASRSKKAE